MAFVLTMFAHSMEGTAVPRPQLILAALSVTLSASGAYATEAAECAHEAMRTWVGSWTCSVHYFDGDEGAFRVETGDDRHEATEQGTKVFLIEDGEEKLLGDFIYTDYGFRQEFVGESGVVVEKNIVTACDGPDDNGVYTVNVQGLYARGDSAALARGTLRMTGTSTRNTLETSLDGESWRWGGEELCVKQEESSDE